MRITPAVCCPPSAGIGEHAEILVLREQNTCFGMGLRKDDVILCARIALDDGGYVVSGGAEGRDDREVATLVRQETHSLVLLAGGILTDKNDLLVGETVGRVSHRGLDIVPRELRICVEEVGLGSTFAKLPE
jgi:hypothetical protein